MVEMLKDMNNWKGVSVRERIGHRIKNIDGEWATCVEYIGNQNIHIQFDNSDYICKDRQWGDFIRGKLVNPYRKSINGIASIGDVKPKQRGVIFQRWHTMIKKCYVPIFPQYKFFGELGITVCDRWLTYEYFLEDIPNLIDCNSAMLDLENCILFMFKGNTEFNIENCTYIAKNVSIIINRNAKNIMSWDQGGKNKFRIYGTKDAKSLTIGYAETTEQATELYNNWLNREIIAPAIHRSELPVGFTINGIV
jgi:hypothetical protein